MIRMMGIRAVAALVVFGAATAASAQATGGTDPATAGFKRAVAQRIMQTDKAKPSNGGLKGISVVGYTLDRSGQMTESWIVRSSGDNALDQRAMTILKKAAPLPAPPAVLFGNEQHAHLSEAWLFTSDGNYKLQTLVSK